MEGKQSDIRDLMDNRSTIGAERFLVSRQMLHQRLRPLMGQDARKIQFENSRSKEDRSLLQ